MKTKFWSTVVSAGFLIVCATPAMADLKIVQTTTLKNTQYAAMRASMTPKQLAAAHKAGMDLMMGIPQVTTTYFTGAKIKVVSGNISLLYNLSTGTKAELFTDTHTYNPNPTPSFNAAGGGFTFTAVSLNKHSRILGHPATAYSISGNSVSFPGARVTGTVWTADDLPRPPVPSDGAASQFAALYSTLKHLPLLLTIKSTGTSAGEINLTSKVTSVQTAAINTKVFSIPQGYKVSAGRSPSL